MFQLRYKHLNCYVFFLSCFSIFPRFHRFLFLFFFLSWNLFDRFACNLRLRSLIFLFYCVFCWTFTRNHFSVWDCEASAKICLIFRSLFLCSLGYRIFTFFLRSYLICRLIYSRLSYFYFRARFFYYLALSIAIVLFSSIFFYLSLTACFFCSCFSTNLLLSYFERYLLKNDFKSIASMDGLFF